MTFDIETHLPQLTSFRQYLHSIAEVSGSENRTAQAIESFLTEKAKPDEIYNGVGGHGIIATYRGASDGEHILLRCELDALPISDEIETEYRSKSDGVGHKCGHDGHMAIICGVAMLMAAERPSKGTVSLLFEPSEETGRGAERVLKDQVFQSLEPDYCFALHNLPGYEPHRIVVRDQVFAAASVGLEVEFQGETAHAAHPEEGRSPAMAMAQLVQALSAVPQYYSALDEATKVTVINAELGERAFGTSPGQATVRATLRTYDDELLTSLQERCLNIAEGIAQTYDLSIDHRWVEPFSATKNAPKAVDIIRKAAEVQELDIREKEAPFSWSEDFGHFSREIPGAMFGLGIGENHAALHAETYDFPDEVIHTGTLMFMQIIKEINS
ncbi:amidohydrolase [Fodinibius salsisoli]|uniref:Amidohydrolase n=1 Tax=Fodinibius salsisoli TaxID=2820877 RepID=A0ABT3PJ32_9BACT|nr:amidohydrolase [Fodinibius salsisoli]MCW9705950.1 amidohydrolase [Fodinibius salsisoli]